MHQNTLGAQWLENIFAEEDLGFQADQTFLQPRWPDALGWAMKNTAYKLRGVILALYSALRPSTVLCPICVSLVQDGYVITSPEQGHKDS